MIDHKLEQIDKIVQWKPKFRVSTFVFFLVFCFFSLTNFLLWSFIPSMYVCRLGWHLTGGPFPCHKIITGSRRIVLSLSSYVAKILCWCDLFRYIFSHPGTVFMVRYVWKLNHIYIYTHSTCMQPGAHVLIVDFFCRFSCISRISPHPKWLKALYGWKQTIDCHLSMELVYWTLRILV